jgi:hypothetical protein
VIDGGWSFIWGAYCIALGSLILASIVVLMRLRAWSRRARELEQSA